MITNVNPIETPNGHGRESHGNHMVLFLVLDAPLLPFDPAGIRFPPIMGGPRPDFETLSPTVFFRFV